MASALDIERRGEHVAIFTLDNADKRNALDPALCARLIAALAEAGRDGTRAIVLTGHGERAFCAGFDITALSASVHGHADEHPFEQLMRAVGHCPVPLVAAVNGVAYGGGCELAAACDLRIAHAGVRLAMPPARLGIVYRTEGLARLAAIAGESRARRMLLTAEPVDAATAHAWGLLDELVEPGEVVPRALALAGAMARLAPAAVQGTRYAFEALLRRRAALTGDDADEVERRRAAAWTSDEAEAARRAYRGK